MKNQEIFEKQQLLIASLIVGCALNFYKSIACRAYVKYPFFQNSKLVKGNSE